MYNFLLKVKLRISEREEVEKRQSYNNLGQIC